MQFCFTPFVVPELYFPSRETREHPLVDFAPSFVHYVLI